MPGYYAGNGAGGMNGNLWKVHFSPDQTGVWGFTTNSSEPLLDGQGGTFEVINSIPCQGYSPGDLPEFSCTGRLQYSGDHYLRFDNGDYWLKGGEDDPEDFLAPGNTVGFNSKEEAIDYLAEKGVNSQYMMLQNIDGDGNNVWPWVGTTPIQAKNNQERIDLLKMAEWDHIFSYFQDKGIVLHLVLEDDEGWTGFNRAFYYQEMIARFSHFNGLIWNISEEYNEKYTADEIKSFAQMIRDLDPYDHPITVHHFESTDNWLPFLGDDRFDLTSLQTVNSPQNQTVADWFELAETSGRIIPISIDETGSLGPTDRELIRQILWSIYIGGGNFELHTFPITSYMDFEPSLEDMHRVRTFVEGLPYWQMRPMNNLVTSGNGYVFAKSGEIYSVYLPTGGQIDLDLTSTSSHFDGYWFNPRNGSSNAIGTIEGGSVRSFSAPSNEDWVILLVMETVSSE